MQVSVPFLTDIRCKQLYLNVNSSMKVCAGEVGQKKGTCQVKAFPFVFLISEICIINLLFINVVG
jgi:hypothetical protein